MWYTRLCSALASFHAAVTLQVAWPFVWLLPSVMFLNRLVWPGRGSAVYIPSTLLRYLAFKLTVDVQQLPALQVRCSSSLDRLCIASVCCSQ